MTPKKKLPKGCNIALIIVGTIIAVLTLSVVSAMRSGDRIEPSESVVGDYNIKTWALPELPTTTHETQATPVNDNPRQLNEVVTVQNLIFTATEIRRSQGGRWASPQDGMEFVAVRFTVENTSQSRQAICLLTTFNSYADGLRVLLAVGSPYTPPLGGELNAGMRLQGYHVVQVPAGARELVLVFNRHRAQGQSFTFEIPHG